MDDFQFEELVGDNRVESQKDSIRNLGDPEDMMIQIMSILNDTVIIPEEGETYTFIYNAKTPNIEYDQHPIVGVTDIFNWGFRGINFHWDKIRNYTWQEIPGQLHIVRQSEIQTMLNIPYAYYLTK